jgi:putative lipoprotein (rSAM/lipoprotein system)
MIRKRFIRRASVFLGSTLGLTGCPFVAEYGAPHASFELDGTVVDAQTGDPIPGIEIEFDANTTTSGEDGAWSMSVPGAWPCGTDCSVTARDIDGSDNGDYAETTVEFEATQVAMEPTEPDTGA